MARGSWGIDAAVVRRWQAANLDAAFRAEWGGADATDDFTYTPLHHEQARPEPPGPYCVYTIGSPPPPEHHGGKTATTEHQIVRYPLQFQIHAKSNSSASGKLRARDLARQVADAFDPNHSLAIDDDEDCFIQTIRQGDYCLRLGDDEWSWVLPYELWVDAQYDT